MIMYFPLLFNVHISFIFLLNYLIHNLVVTYLIEILTVFYTVFLGTKHIPDWYVIWYYHVYYTANVFLLPAG